MEYCLQRLPSRSKYDAIQPHLCHIEKGHTDPHAEFPFLAELEKSHPSVAEKITRDSVMTTGAAWKSEDAGPNRILRWVMLLPDDELLKYGIRMSALKPQVVAKLREKAAPYDACIEVAIKLAWSVYQMADAPPPSSPLKAYLEAHFGPMTPNSTTCLICRAPVSFTLFSFAVRGRANLETGHSNPRSHNTHNVGFAHRECNIAQGAKTLTEFYTWLQEILERVGLLTTRSPDAQIREAGLEE